MKLLSNNFSGMCCLQAYRVHRIGKQWSDWFEVLWWTSIRYKTGNDLTTTLADSLTGTWRSQNEMQKTCPWKFFYRSVADAMYSFCCNKLVNTNHTLDFSGQDDSFPMTLPALYFFCLKCAKRFWRHKNTLNWHTCRRMLEVKRVHFINQTTTHERNDQLWQQGMINYGNQLW